MLGYKDQAEPFEQGWFLSSDLAQRDEQGNFYFVGRRDDVLTLGGYRVSPLEVETVINASPLVAESAVVARELGEGRRVMLCFVVPTAGAEPTELVAERILAYAHKELADYKVPRELKFVDELPKTRNGKLKRGVLRQMVNGEK